MPVFVSVSVSVCPYHPHHLQKRPCSSNITLPVVGPDAEVVVVVIAVVVVGTDGEAVVIAVHCSKEGASLGPPTD